ncbi:MYG1 family protein [Mobilitalea sibirica]|uniref:MYG1 family protein n=1 Tax=Mobilitalea sibirica TaxID=1462919 RepID=A0A8J7L0C3_9FIRM|nr:MYG1 family protein [Mobilitalea sibirica]MBH1942033.1 MYG1 family protein [Mobilitalea sibirica]
MIDNKMPDKAFTHGGKFHADDVFSAALLTYLNPNIIIERGFEIPEDYDGIVFDIGFGEFDHHQANSRVRENGIPYAAFGLLWEEFGHEILEEVEAERFDRSFVQPLDLCDNTGCDHAIARAISLFNPVWDDTRSVEEAFWEAVEFALTILTKRFEYAKSLVRAEEVVRKALESAKNGILILPIYTPWRSVVQDTNILFVIYPSDRGGFNAQVVPKDEDDRDLKIAFPEEWCGLEAQRLKEVTGIETITFCHSSGFLIAADTLEDTVKACEMAEEVMFIGVSKD